MEEKYTYTLKTQLMGQPHEEECVINKDVFYPYGEVKEGLETRGQYGFMRIVKVYDEPHYKHGKFIAESITWEEANANVKK